MHPEIRRHLDDLSKAVEAFPWHDQEAYAVFMTQTYYYSRHTTRILAFAASRFSFEDEATHQRFIDHCKEEMRHEKLADRDVKNVGFNLSDAPELPSTRAFYQCHYQSIEANGPWSIFGYILALEGAAAEKGHWIYEQIKKAHGEKAALFMKVHATEDVGHMEEALKQIAHVSKEDLEHIIRHMAVTCSLYSAMMRDSASFAAGKKGKKAA